MFLSDGVCLVNMGRKHFLEHGINSVSLYDILKTIEVVCLLRALKDANTAAMEEQALKEVGRSN